MNTSHVAPDIAPASGPGTVPPAVSGPSFVEALVDPANVFGRPEAVAAHPWFSDEEKRTILLSWARDALAIEQVAAGRLPADLRPRSCTDAVIEALARFDPSAAREYVGAVRAIRGDRTGRRGRRSASPERGGINRLSA
ncbi:hypothetical protein [Microvirga thermotolerans]|uniref:Uncharacterized protein n=1 Tax=Microvirga thermotolerans TaxID=2651334 RepID=A0A5P9JSG6_9HYPH|nr:hypothetical protein [Microvirga thermotolerans]QFU15041.1 hypothetical protein GDR74_01745 [Microvirga thermotolerans]